jgi:hypothetical protein
MLGLFPVYFRVVMDTNGDMKRLPHENLTAGVLRLNSLQYAGQLSRS